MHVVVFDKCAPLVSDPGMFSYQFNLFHGRLLPAPTEAKGAVLLRNTFVDSVVSLPGSVRYIGHSICVCEDISNRLGKVIGLERVPITHEHTFYLPYAIGKDAPDTLRDIEPYIGEAMDRLDKRLFRTASTPTSKYHLYRIRSYKDLPSTSRRRLTGNEIFNNWPEEGEVITDEAMMDRIGMCTNEFGKQVSSRVFELLSEHLVEPWFRSWTLKI